MEYSYLGRETKKYAGESVHPTPCAWQLVQRIESMRALILLAALLLCAAAVRSQSTGARIATATGRSLGMAPGCQPWAELGGAPQLGCSCRSGHFYIGWQARAGAEPRSSLQLQCRAQARRRPRLPLPAPSPGALPGPLAAAGSTNMDNPCYTNPAADACGAYFRPEGDLVADAQAICSAAGSLSGCTLWGHCKVRGCGSAGSAARAQAVQS